MYEAHFGFRHAPFGLTPDTRFYFSEGSHQEGLNTLLVALRSGEGFLKVTGEIGLGKTLLCRQLLNALGPGFVSAYVPNPAVTPRALFQTVGDELGCPIEYVQWTAARQMATVGEAGSRGGARLYLDLPLGVQPSSYDVYRERDVFVLGTNSGAPPDGFFTEGQAWGTPPIHPEKIRAHRYGYVIESLRHHLAFAGVLRLDHVMGLHRLFMVPNGMHAKEGVYVHYRAEELYAILSVEAHRTGTAIVGEDLGTVPDHVRGKMSEHGIRRMFVTPFEITGNDEHPLRTPQPNTRGCFNTHDMVPFAGFARG
jgi:hypothetical protein